MIEHASAEERKDLFRRLLNVLWLRPERALADSYQLFSAGKLLGKEFEQPSLEYGCTEGTNTFIMLGGEFSPEFDVYTGVSWTKDSHIKSSLDNDYFNFVSRDYIPKIHKYPNSKFTVGISWREAHLEKSNYLGMYEKTELVELDAPLSQFEDDLFATIWAPNLFWTSDNSLRMLLDELRRILRKDGRIIAILPDESQKNHVLMRHIEDFPTQYHQWLKDLDRGMNTNLTRHAYSLDKWAGIFSECGLAITQHQRFLPSVVGEIYEIGFRPMFPVFMNIYEKLKDNSSKDFQEVKNHWVDTCYHFFSPLCDTDWMEKMGMDWLWHAFELKKP